jgi:hypothetical protein
VIILNATTKSVEVLLGGAVTTTQLPIVAAFVDVGLTTYTPGSSDTQSNDGNAVTAVAAPGANLQRQVKLLTVYNADTAAATVTVRYNNNGTLRIVATVTLAVGSTLVYTDGEGLRVITKDGEIRILSSGGGAPTGAEYLVGAAHADLSAERVVTNTPTVEWDLATAAQAKARGAVAVNAQTGTTYTVVLGDRGKLVTHSNAGPVAVTLPQATGDFGAGWFYWVENRGAGTVTITPTTSTIDGAASLALTTNQGVLIASDGTNYFTMRGIGGGGGTPGGANTQVQFNDSGAFGGDAGLTYNKTTDALTLAGLLDLSGAAAGQIKFPATQNPSSDPNTFDDCERGNWTPTIGGATSESGQTYGVREGRYVKLGPLVWIGCEVELTNKGTITGGVVIKGLPFAAVAPAGTNLGSTALQWASLATTWVIVLMRGVENGGTQVDIAGATAAAVTANTQLQTADIGNSTLFRMQILYRTA